MPPSTLRNIMRGTMTEMHSLATRSNISKRSLTNGQVNAIFGGATAGLILLILIVGILTRRFRNKAKEQEKMKSGADKEYLARRRSVYSLSLMMEVGDEKDTGTPKGRSVSSMALASEAGTPVTERRRSLLSLNMMTADDINRSENAASSEKGEMEGKTNSEKASGSDKVPSPGKAPLEKKTSSENVATQKKSGSQKTELPVAESPKPFTVEFGYSVAAPSKVYTPTAGPSSQATTPTATQGEFSPKMISLKKISSKAIATNLTPSKNGSLSNGNSRSVSPRNVSPKNSPSVSPPRLSTPPQTAASSTSLPKIKTPTKSTSSTVLGKKVGSRKASPVTEGPSTSITDGTIVGDIVPKRRATPELEPLSWPEKPLQLRIAESHSSLRLIESNNSQEKKKQDMVTDDAPTLDTQASGNLERWTTASEESDEGTGPNKSTVSNKRPSVTDNKSLG